MPTFRPHSRPGKLAIVDGRSAEGRRLREIRQELVAHVGGQPSVVQRMLIERASMLALRIELLDKKALSDRKAPDTDPQRYLAWNAALSRLLRQLGLEGASEARTPTLAELLAAAPAPPRADAL